MDKIQPESPILDIQTAFITLPSATQLSANPENDLIQYLSYKSSNLSDELEISS